MIIVINSGQFKRMHCAHDKAHRHHSGHGQNIELLEDQLLEERQELNTHQNHFELFEML